MRQAPRREPGRATGESIALHWPSRQAACSSRVGFAIVPAPDSGAPGRAVGVATNCSAHTGEGTDLMSRRVATVPAKRVSPDAAAGLVESGMWLDYGAGLCGPDAFDKALAARGSDLRAVKIRSCLSMRPRAVV